VGRFALVGCCLLSAVAAAADGVIRGEVRFVGKADRSGAVVYVTGFEEPPPGTAVQLRQCGKRFIPSLLVVRAGQAVDFTNNDTVVHNVFSPVGHLDMGRSRPGSHLSHLFKKPGGVDLYCDIHEEMKAALVVVPNHAYAVTGPDGAFEIPRVPSGTWTVVAWQPEGAAAEQKVTVAPGEAATVTLELPVARSGPHLDRNLRSYKDHPREYEADAGVAMGCPAEPAPPEVADGGRRPSEVRGGPVFERAQVLREAADQLEKAAAEQQRGNRSLAGRLFLAAASLVGPDVLEGVASLFQEGAPPRVITPLRQLSVDSPPQPFAAGSSEVDNPRARPEKSSLVGDIQLDGQPLGEGRAVVMLEPLRGEHRRPAPQKAVMEQRGRQFAPHLLVVPKGSTVSFPNFDPIYHNVFSRSEVQPFDLGLYVKGQTRDMTFDHEGVFKLGCDLHANMSAFVVVVAQPHYLVSEPGGAFRFKSLRPGRYRLSAWSERGTLTAPQEVLVKPGPNTVSVALGSTGPADNLDKYGAPR